MARVIVVAEHHADSRDAAGGDGPTFQLKERVTSADVRDPHVAAQLIERIGWALVDAEHEESRRAAHPDPVRERHDSVSDRHSTGAARGVPGRKTSA